MSKMLDLYRESFKLFIQSALKDRGGLHCSECKNMVLKSNKIYYIRYNTIYKIICEVCFNRIEHNNIDFKELGIYHQLGEENDENL